MLFEIQSVKLEITGNLQITDKSSVIYLPVHGRGSLFQINEYLPLRSNKGYIHVISIMIKESVVTSFIKIQKREELRDTY